MILARAWFSDSVMNRSWMSGLASSNLSTAAGVGHLRVRHHRDRDGVLRRAERAGAGTAGRQRQPGRGHARCQSVQSSLHFHLHLLRGQIARAQSMSHTSSLASLPRNAPRVAWCFAAPLEIRMVFSQVRMSSSGTENRPLLQFGVDRHAVGVEEPPISPPRPTRSARRASGCPGSCPRTASSRSTRRRRRTHHVGAPAGLQRRDISESLRIDATVDGSAYSGAGSRMVLARSIRAAAEDELRAGLVRGRRHGAVELDHRPAARDPGRQCRHRDLFGPQVNPRTSVGEAGTSSAAAARPTLANAGPSGRRRRCRGPRRPSVRPNRCSSSRSSRRAGRRACPGGTTTSMRTSPLAWRPGDQPSRRRPGYPEPGRDLGLGEARRGSRASPRAEPAADPRGTRRGRRTACGRRSSRQPRRSTSMWPRNRLAFRACEHLLRDASRCSSR